MRAFGGRPLTAIVDPRRVSPRALAEFAERAGASLMTSSYLERRESIRILAWLATRASLDPAQATRHRHHLGAWLSRVGGPALAKSA